MKIAVIGAGPAGLTAAYILSKNNYEVDVFEANSQVGGLSATISLWNQKVDLGPHRFFSTDPRVNELWFELVKNDYRSVKRLTRIYYKNNFFDYPLTFKSVLRNVGIRTALLCILSYLKQKVLPSKEDGSFESWVCRRFGRRLFSIFFKSYSEKLWGIPCSDIDSDFAAQRIRKLSLFEALKNIFFKGTKNKHKTLIDQFLYPKGGSGMLYERMADALKSAGNNIYLNTPVKRLINGRDRIEGIELNNGTILHYDHVISTMPFTNLISGLANIPREIAALSAKLKFRNTILVYLLVEAIDIFPDNWIYIHSSNLKMGRVTNFRNWVPELYGNEKNTILAVEFWCNPLDGFSKWPDEQLINLAKTEIVEAKLADERIVKDGHVIRINKSYPVYEKGYKSYLNPLNQYLSQFNNLSVIGRYGSFKYNNQDHSILMGLMSAENIMNHTKHNLSLINSDFDTYQEDGYIQQPSTSKL